MKGWKPKRRNKSINNFTKRESDGIPNNRTSKAFIFMLFKDFMVI